jgi:hypothetical protein
VTITFVFRYDDANSNDFDSVSSPPLTPRRARHLVFQQPVHRPSRAPDARLGFQVAEVGRPPHLPLHLLLYAALL